MPPCFFVFSNAEMVRDIGHRKQNNFPKPAEDFEPIRFWGENIVSAPGGDDWKKHRSAPPPHEPNLFFSFFFKVKLFICVFLLNLKPKGELGCSPSGTTFVFLICVFILLLPYGSVLFTPAFSSGNLELLAQCMVNLTNSFMERWERQCVVTSQEHGQFLEVVMDKELMQVQQQHKTLSPRCMISSSNLNYTSANSAI